MKLRRSPEGFTLIELLVVISIIAVLASLAVPAVTGALVKGQLAQAMSNARQIHMAAMSMAIDGATNSDVSLGWPGDLKDNSQIASLPDYVNRLAAYDYLKPGDLKVFSTAGIVAYVPTGAMTTGTGAKLTPEFDEKNSAYKVYLVHDNDAANTLFLATKNYSYNTAFPADSSTLKPFGDKGFVVLRKGGDASVLKRQQAETPNLVGKLPGDAEGTNSTGDGSALLQMK